MFSFAIFVLEEICHIWSLSLDMLLVRMRTSYGKGFICSTGLNQDPNQCSEEPKATFEQCPRRQAPVHNPIILRIIFILLFVYIVIILFAHLRILRRCSKP